jgi:HAD superfamily hydrolase (TIGR01509 family)
MKGAYVMTGAVIFDIGGVLAHDVWEHLLLDNDGIRSKYPNLGENELERIGKLLWEAFAYLPETQRSNWQALERRYWRQFIKYFGRQLPPNVSPEEFIQMTDKFIKPVEGMIPLLDRLQSKGIDLAICSNNNEFWFRRQMDKLGLHRFFSPSKIILSCRIGVSKSSPRFEMFHAAADALRVIKAKCVFVDDRDENVKRARQCGMIGILFTNAQQLDKLLNCIFC